MESVGVRELRQDASGLLDRVARTGASIEITNHGRPVARLVPIPRAPTPTTRAELVEACVLRPGRGDILDVRPVEAPPGSPSTTDLLAADRAER